MLLVLIFFRTVRDGRRGVGFFFSTIGGDNRSGENGVEFNDENSADESAGVSSGVGDCSWTSIDPNGALCGRGDMSMSMSMPSVTPGEDAIGGVVATAHDSQHMKSVLRVGDVSGEMGELTLISGLEHIANEECTSWCWCVAWTKNMLTSAAYRLFVQSLSSIPLIYMHILR
jgi:hypothetical protein